MRIPTGAAIPRSQPATRRTSMSREVQQQRRGYAQAVLRALARSHLGRPTAQVQRCCATLFRRWVCACRPRRCMNSPRTSPRDGPSSCPDPHLWRPPRRVHRRSATHLPVRPAHGGGQGVARNGFVQPGPSARTGLERPWRSCSVPGLGTPSAGHEISRAWTAPAPVGAAVELADRVGPVVPRWLPSPRMAATVGRTSDVLDRLVADRGDGSVGP
jgi:hypothetical protein